jgi:hypothetical protein
MRKVKLRMNELEKYNIIKNLVDNDGNKNTAAIKLHISKRQVDRLIIKYKEKGKSSFVHGNRGHIPTKALDKSISENIILLYQNKYYDCNFNHFKDLLKDRENINVSYNFIYNNLTTKGIYSPKIRKSTRKKLKKAEVLLKKENQTKSKKELDIMVNHLMDIEDSHPRQEKPKYFGEVIEMDGSIHLWFGPIKTCLHLAIDLCTGTIVGGIFQSQETLRGYYIIYKQILEKYGIPLLFKTDNRTVFNYESLSKEKRTSDKDILTQFGYACSILGTDLETTSISQSKGSIERANGTFQGRLVQELRIEGITNIDDANEYLVNKFIPNFNKRFALNYKKYPSVFEASPNANKINYTLAILSTRKIDNGNSLKFKNKYYQPYDSSNHLICFKPHTECLVIEAFDGSIMVTIDDIVYQLKELEKHKKVSANLNELLEVVPKEKKVYIPPMTHPWRATSFKKQLEKAHTNHVYA